MGGKGSKQSQINNFLKKQEQNEERLYRILLLGPGDSGKSTILKQMRMIETMLQNEDKQSDNDKHESIYSDTIPLMREAILNYMYILCKENVMLSNNNKISDELKTDIKINDKNTKLRDHVALTNSQQWNSLNNDNNENDNDNDDYENKLEDDNENVEYTHNRALFEDFEQIIETYIGPLWDDDGIKNTLKYRALFTDQIPDNVSYFMNKMFDISGNDWKATFDDYIRLRTRTTGAQIVNINIDLDRLSDNKSQNMGNYKFEFTDIGGQASERGKWARVMDDKIKVVLFVVAISEYDLPLYEDSNQKRMEDALHAFNKLLTHESGKQGQKFAENKQIVILFNKFDLFPSKLETVPLSSIDEYSDFKCNDPQHMVEAAESYFKDKFKKVISDIIEKQQNKNNNDDEKVDNNNNNKNKHRRQPSFLQFDTNKQLSFHRSEALNTGLIRAIFHKITLNLVTGNLEKMGMGGAVNLG